MTVQVLFIGVNKVPLEEVQLLLVLHVGGVVEADLIEIAKDLLDEDGSVVTERLSVFIADFKCLDVEDIPSPSLVCLAVECSIDNILVYIRIVRILVLLLLVSLDLASAFLFLLLGQLEADPLPTLDDDVGLGVVDDVVDEELDGLGDEEVGEIFVRERHRINPVSCALLLDLSDDISAERANFDIFFLEFVILNGVHMLVQVLLSVLVAVVQVHGLRLLHDAQFAEDLLFFLEVRDADLHLWLDKDAEAARLGNLRL